MRQEIATSALNGSLHVSTIVIIITIIIIIIIAKWATIQNNFNSKLGFGIA